MTVLNSDPLLCGCTASTYKRLCHFGPIVTGVIRGFGFFFYRKIYSRAAFSVIEILLEIKLFILSLFKTGAVFATRGQLMSIIAGGEEIEPSVSVFP